ncbi:MAG: hypothetical protein SF051_12290, partial [Elusimicrobiota bacterium]|nr:hypothetical protein [Elusimicrobiota bacterium]
MNLPERLSRALAVVLCAALVHAALPFEALAGVITRVPAASAPISAAPGAAALGGRAVLTRTAASPSSLVAPSLNLTAPAAGLTPRLDAEKAPAPAVERNAPEPVVDTPGALTPAATPRPGRAAPASDDAKAAAPLAPETAAAPSDSPVSGVEFKAEPRASAVADASRIASAFAALKRAFATRSVESFGAASDAPSAVSSRAPPAASASIAAARLAPAGDRVA